MPIKVYTKTKEEPVLNLVTREEWEGKPPLPNGPQLEHPISIVRYSHTYTFECFNQVDCSRWMRRIQRAHMEQNKVDIQFNFLIGSDERIYEGAGWYADCWKPPELRHLHKKCLDIAYLGNYTISYPEKELQDLAKKIIDYGVFHNYMTPRVKILRITDPDCTIIDN
ncbi:peptidoglycan-recognition protein LF-like [Macrosteles quadrilineatus]|uniref:peptidoglycan-recognition protein LF-like n=1 Tax=Macrosteles quadrilineatus TaxID=74068 RepID=UPI0023E2247C|nr:peptidoglycan-recognition protein LF-like [Macrosteles quadrilineatus]XP_054270238.1 peptidoglycan-recognition protein LF-like [Macrosteles quadrilineatus]